MNNEIKFRLAVDGVQQVNQGLASVGRGLDDMQSGATGAGARVADALSQVPGAARVSAAQTAAAWRQLPMQLQDVAVSLQGGMSPFTVLMQQGPQITSAFGGVRETVRAFASAIPPAAAAVSALAVGLGAAAIAAYRGSQELGAYERSLINTGNRIGMTADQLANMAERMDGLDNVTRGQAAEALALLAAQAGISSAGIERMTAAAIEMENAGGQAVAETARQFGELARDPLQASVKLHDQTGFLTAALYRQIKALQDQGRTVEAAKIAQEAYLSTLEQRTPKLVANLGALERGWASVKSVAREAWDAMLGIGRQDTAQEQLAKLDKDLEDLQARFRANAWRGKLAQDEYAREKARIDGQKTALQEQLRLQQRSVDLQRESVAQTDAAIAADKAKKPASTRESAADPYAAERAAAQDWARAMQDFARAGATADAQADSLTRSQARLVEYLQSPGYRNASEPMRQLALAEAYAAIGAEQHAESRRQLARITADAARAHDQWLASLARGAESVGQQVQAMRDEAQAAALAADRKIGLAQAIQLVAIERLREKQVEMMGDEQAVAAIQREIDARRQLAAEFARGAGRQAADAYLQDPTAGLSAGWDRVTQSIGGTVSALMRLAETQAAYDAAVRGAAGNQDQLARIELQRAQQQAGAYATVIGAAKGLFKEHTAGYKLMAGAEKAYRAYQIGAAVASAAREMGLISAVTAAKVMGVGTQAGAVVAGQATETAAVTAGEAARNTAKVPGVFMAFMSALGPWGMAAAGVAIAAVLGGAFGGRGGSVDMTERRQASNGTGTVLGDPTAQSESIARSIERLTDVDTMTMRYSAQMLASLRSIEASMAGVSVQILRAGGITTGRNLGIQTGVLATNVGDPILGALGIDDMARNLPVIGRVIGSLQSMWGKTTAHIIDAGLTLEATIADLLEGDGLQQYADVRITRSSWFGARKKTRTETQFGDVGDDVTRQFGLVFQGVADSLEAASMAMGADAARVGERLADYVIEIPRLSLEGLTGDDLQEAIAAAVGAQADQMARTVFEGLDEWQRIGEGYYETVVRVASGTEVARQTLAGLGVDMVKLSDVTRQQGDVAAELVRDSLIAVETTRAWDAATKQVTATVSGIGEVLAAVDGGAEDIRAVYLTLTATRSAFRGLGLSADAVGRDLLAGAGGLDALAGAVSSYEDAFATAPERIAARSETLREQFGRLGLALPATADAYRALVRGIDTSTASGRELLGQVLTLSDGMRELLDAVQDTTGGIADEIERIRGLMAGGGTAGQSLAQLQARFAIQSAQARAGDAAALADLPAASKALLDAAADQIGSRADLVRLQASTAASLQGVLDSVRAAALAPAAQPASATAAPVAPAVPASDPALQDMLAELQRLRTASERQAEQARQRDAQIVELQQSVAAATSETARILRDITPNGTAIAIAPEREYGA